MSIIRTKKAALWALALILVLGVFVLLAPEARAAGPEISSVKEVKHDNGESTIVPGEINPNRNAGYYTAGSLLPPS